MQLKTGSALTWLRYSPHWTFSGRRTQAMDVFIKLRAEQHQVELL
jgi:hypothetical protein